MSNKSTLVEEECPLRKLGTVLHVSGSGRLVLRTKTKVKIGIQAFDENLRAIGRIVEVFGPVRNPYISIKSAIDDSKRYVGHPLYLYSNREKTGR